MCGIVHVMRFDKKLACKMVAKRYQKQKDRGRSGFGYVALQNGKLVEYMRTKTEEEILKELEKVTTDEIMFHHRLPTSTPNMSQCAHPIYVHNDYLKHDYFVIHNGIISNASDLKKAHNELGFVYNTEVQSVWQGKNETVVDQVKFNDSESLAIELAMDLDTGDKREGVDSLYGSIAFICLQVDKATGEAVNLYFGRNERNPLMLDEKRGQYIAITSEGKGKEIKAGVLHTYNYATTELSEVPYKIGYTYVMPTSKHMGYGRDDEENFSPRDEDGIPSIYQVKDHAVHNLLDKPKAEPDNEIDDLPLKDQPSHSEEAKYMAAWDEFKELREMYAKIENSQAEGDLWIADVYEQRMEELADFMDQYELDYFSKH